MILRDVLATSAVGLAVSVPIAAQVVRVAGSALVGLLAVDTAGVAAVAGCTVVVVVAAALAPAVRAARIDVAALLRL